MNTELVVEPTRERKAGVWQEVIHAVFGEAQKDLLLNIEGVNVGCSLSMLFSRGGLSFSHEPPCI